MVRIKTSKSKFVYLHVCLGKSLNDCLTKPCDPSSKKPSPVSEISSRIKLEFSGSKDYEIGLYNMLKIDPDKLNDDLLAALCKDLASVHIYSGRKTFFEAQNVAIIEHQQC